MEKIGELDKRYSTILDFHMALVNCDLVDTGNNGPMTIWLNKRRGAASVQDRLDPFVYKKGW